MCAFFCPNKWFDFMAPHNQFNEDNKIYSFEFDDIQKVNGMDLRSTKSNFKKFNLNNEHLLDFKCARRNSSQIKRICMTNIVRCLSWIIKCNLTLHFKSVNQRDLQVCRCRKLNVLTCTQLVLYIKPISRRKKI